MMGHLDFSLTGMATYLNNVHDVYFPPNFYWFCTAGNFVLFGAFLTSTFLILNMTFDRFYSVIRPHKAASFNTVKRAKITILTISILSFLYNIPHLFFTTIDGKQCLPFAAALHKMHGKIYYWLTFTLTFALPFVLLLTMNSVIIHTIRIRSLLKVKGSQGQCQSKNPKAKKEGQGRKMSSTSSTNKSSDRQIFAILFLVTFGFLVLTMPGNLLILYIMFVDETESPEIFAGYYLFYNIGQKMYYTNSGINFFMYVMSGQKFRKDLVRLFKCKDVKHRTDSTSTSVATVTENIPV